MHGGAGLNLLVQTIRATIRCAETAGEQAKSQATELAASCDRLVEVTAALHACEPQRALANATVYLEATGHLVVGWLWLDQLLATGDRDEPFYQGKRQAAAYFYRWELPKIGPMFDLLASLDPTVLDTPADCL